MDWNEWSIGLNECIRSKGMIHWIERNDPDDWKNPLNWMNVLDWKEWSIGLKGMIYWIERNDLLDWKEWSILNECIELKGIIHGLKESIEVNECIGIFQ